MHQNAYNILNYPADTGGCGFYRLIFQKMALQTMTKDMRFIESFKFIADPNFYRDIRMVRLQRQVSNEQCSFFLNFLKRYSMAMGYWLVYEVDDVVSFDDIPAYNCARHAFNNDLFFSNVMNILRECDFMTVTTEELKKYYVDKYKLESDKVLVIPNYIPRWWIGDTYQLPRQVQLFDANRRKPRIGLPLSSSHYDLTGTNQYIDDIHHITGFIRSTVDKYQWCFVGHVPKLLEDLARDKKIEVLPGSDVLNYPREMWERGQFQAIVAPLQDNIFNKSKSNIKLLESYALGIPCITQDLPCYSKYHDLVFKDANGLQNQLDKVLRDKDRYKKIVRENRIKVDTGPIGSDGHFQNGAWLEKNINKWYRLYSLPQKTLCLDLRKAKRSLQEQNTSNEEIKVQL
jgi:O-antigen biosynthesis protein